MKKRILIILLIIIGFVSVGGYFLTRKKCPSGMVAYWKFDEGEGNTAYDSVDENDGVIYGASWVTGRIGGALSFDGVDDRVKIPANTVSGTTLTVNLWVKTNDTEYCLISGAKDHSYDNEYLIYFHEDHGSKLELYYHDNRGFGGDGGYLTNITANDSLWHMITVVTEVDKTKIYVDGSLEETTDYGSISSFNVKGLWIGADQDSVDGGWETSQQFNGIIDEVAIYNRALKPEEIKQHYNWGIDGIGYCGS